MPLGVGWQDYQSLTHTHTPPTIPFSPCRFILPTLSILLFIHAQRPLSVCLHSWASTFTMVVGFLLARRFMVCSFLTRRESLFILACIGWSVRSSWWSIHLTQGEWFTLMLFVRLLWRFSIRVETSELFSRGSTFSRSQERSCVSVVIYVFPQSGNQVCFSCVLGSLIMFWGCCLPHALLAVVSNYILGPLCIRSEPLLVYAISFCDCIKEQCVLGFWMLDGC